MAATLARPHTRPCPLPYDPCLPGLGWAPSGSCPVCRGLHRCRRPRRRRHPGHRGPSPAGRCWARWGSCPSSPGAHPHPWMGERDSDDELSRGWRQGCPLESPPAPQMPPYWSWSLSQASPTKSWSTSPWGVGQGGRRDPGSGQWNSEAFHLPQFEPRSSGRRGAPPKPAGALRGVGPAGAGLRSPGPGCSSGGSCRRHPLHHRQFRPEGQ